MITFACTCGHSITIKQELAGTKVQCAACASMVAAPFVTMAPLSRAAAPATVVPSDPYATGSKSDAPSHSHHGEETLGARFQTPGSAPNFLAPAEAPDEIGRLGGYRVLRVLGKGGMGMVLEAEDPKLKRRVALKVMLPQFAHDAAAKQRFLREAQAAAALEHDHIITIHQVGEEYGVPFLAMPLLKGESLADCVKREGKLSIADVLRIGAEIADGLAAAHDKGLIHRDIKPANVWLEGNRRRVKILDFGLARPVGVDDAHLTGTGVVIGTPAYMAPEQARGNKVDSRADLFSLGCVLYHLTTGQMPFKGNDTFAMLTALAVDTPADPRELDSSIPLELSALILQLLAKKPEERPASASEVRDRLNALVGTGSTIRSPGPGVDTKVAPQPAATTRVIAPEPVSADVAKPVQPVAAQPRRSRIGLLIAVACLLVFVGISVLFGGQIFRVVTNKGELVIEVQDPDIVVKLVQNGVVVEEKTSKREFTLTAGNGEIDVLEKDGVKLTTKQFELTRGGKTTVKVTLEELAEARKPKDPDRRAAEWVLLIGGSVRVNEADRDIKAAGDLPPGMLILRGAQLGVNPKVNDAGLANFKDCKNLESLGLAMTEVGDAGLTYFKDSKNIANINLNATKVSNAGLAHLKDFKELKHLLLENTQVSDEGLGHLKDCNKLEILNLGVTQVTKLSLADLKSLRIVDLSGSQVSDAGLTQLTGLTKLEILRFLKTKVSESSVKKLSAALPNCKIESDFGVFGPTNVVAPPIKIDDLRWLLGLKAKVTLRPKTGDDVTIEKVEEIPAEPATIVGVELPDITVITDDVLKRVATLETLEDLRTASSIGLKSPATRAGFSHLGALVNLRRLTLGGRSAEAPDFEFLARLQKLEDLRLSYVDIKPWPKSMEHVARLPNLKAISIHRSGSVPEEALALLTKMPRLRFLQLQDAGVKPEEVQRFAEKAPWIQIHEGAKVLAEPRVPHPISLVPPGLAPGDAYHLAFVTSEARDAKSMDIADYNAFVNSVADKAGIGPKQSQHSPVGPIQWYAICSTQNVVARDNVKVSGPIFNMEGLRIAGGAPELWSGKLQNPILVNQFGLQPSKSSLRVWTGASIEGTRAEPLGNVRTTYGLTHSRTSTWINSKEHGDGTPMRPYFALSQRLIVPKKTTSLKTTITPKDGPVPLLPLLDLKKDVVAGAWKQDPDFTLRTLPDPRIWRGVVFPVSIHGDCRVKYEFTHHAGLDGVDMAFPVGATQAHVMVGSNNNNRSGLGSIDGKPFDENATTRRKMSFVKEKRNVIVIEVRTEGDNANVNAVWNGDKIVNWSGPVAKLSLPAGDGAKNRSAIALRVSDLCSNSSIHLVTLEMITGEAKVLRP